VCGDLKARDIRVSAELGDGRLNAKIRECQNRKIPYMLVVGEREANESTVSIRRRDGTQMEPLKIEAFAEYVEEKIKSRSLEL
jgi:threonyl-tRNA synthetase